MFLKLHFFFLLGTSRIVLTGLSYGQVGRLLSAGQWSAARIVELHRQVWPPKNPFVTFLSLSANWMQRWQDLRRWKTHVMGKTWVPKWQRRADWALPPTSPWQPRSHTELWHELYRAKPLRLGSFGIAISLPEVIHVNIGEQPLYLTHFPPDCATQGSTHKKPRCIQIMTFQFRFRNDLTFRYFPTSYK